MGRLYPARIRDHIWLKVSSKIKASRGHICEDCGAIGGFPNDPLVVHHIDFNPHNDEDNNLRVLCSKCHDVTHNWRRD